MQLFHKETKVSTNRKGEMHARNEKKLRIRPQ